MGDLSSKLIGVRAQISPGLRLVTGVRAQHLRAHLSKADRGTECEAQTSRNFSNVGISVGTGFRPVQVAATGSREREGGSTTARDAGTLAGLRFSDCGRTLALRPAGGLFGR